MMISLVNIRDSLATLLKSGFEGWKVHFDNVERPQAPYFYVEMAARAKSLDEAYSERRVSLTVSAILPLNKAGRVSRKELFEIADKLDGLIRPVFRVQDRAITVLDANHVIVDDILHYYFELEFVDAVERPYVDTMEELDMDLTMEDLTMKGMNINGE